MEALPLLNGATLSLWWISPFLAILFSIAVGPLLAPTYWHKNYGKITFAWSLVTVFLLWAKLGLGGMSWAVSETYGSHFFPFIIFVGCFYLIANGIYIRLDGVSNPYRNTLFLLVGALIANILGTTGAAMLLIKPFLAFNQARQHKTHLLVFFIFLVCNIGGCLTPLGDPPLFLGFLEGVPFLWPAQNLLGPFLIVGLPLLGVFFLLDYWFYRREGQDRPRVSRRLHLEVKGKRQLFILAAVIATLIGSAMMPDRSVSLGGLRLPLNDLLRDGLLLGFGVLAYRLTPKAYHRLTQFSWAPLQEVAILFAGIFLTAMPVFEMLKAGPAGSFAWLVTAMQTPTGPAPSLFFWIPGLLSSFLDNAPTYLLFFNLAGGDVTVLTGPLNKILVAISAGAVFMGAMTYIGNAPNFMVKSIVEEQEIPMPSFFGYLGWSCLFLLPLFVLLNALYF